MSQELKELKQKFAAKEAELKKAIANEELYLGNSNKNKKIIRSLDELNALHKSSEISKELWELRKKRSLLEAEQRKQH